jgi:hypothetical protein
MTKVFKKITFTLILSSVLAISGLAQGAEFWQGGRPKQEKPKEQPKETPKKGGDDRGGRGDDRGRGKKP